MRMRAVIATCGFAACVAAFAQGPAAVPPVPGTGIASALFGLREMDMHIHAGMEREIPLNEWIDASVKDGRRVIVLLDHLELYRKTPEEYQAWAKEKKFPAWYTGGSAGHKALMADFDAAIAGRKDVILFKGWEISEDELDTGLEEAPMRMAEVIGWHISPHNVGDPPDGTKLIKRIQQVKEAQKRFPVPMILYHPFTMRIENIQRKAAAKGRDLKTLTVDEYRFFQPGQQEQAASLLKGGSVYIEMASASAAYFNDPIVREAMIADIKPLAEMGVQFIVSTDKHHATKGEKSFQPEAYCAPCGITPENTNTIVRELLAQRARRALDRGAPDSAAKP
ncbi:MAG: hypothetical protein HZB26_14770 [Candidatus Hydrogenedentes bacterium]|nr:hypothetical protein [Candidatus Hydrogenedentota bacterium]